MIIGLEAILQGKKAGKGLASVRFKINKHQRLCHTFILFTKRIASSNSTGFFSSGSLISYPFGRKVLNPRIRSRCPLNNSLTLIITPVVSILQSTERHRIKKSRQTKREIKRVENPKIENFQPLALEILHDFKKFIVFLPLILKYIFHGL